jgi:hypothetical protein
MLCVEIFIFVSFPFSNVISPIFSKIATIPIYENIIYSKLFIFLLIIVTSIGTTAKKDIEFDPIKQITLPLVFGFLLFFGAAFLLTRRETAYFMHVWNLFYILSSVIGAVLISISLDNISKHVKSNLLKDRFNMENESFEQAQKKIENEYSVNIPMKYLWKGKIWKGWINIVNPFRGTLLIGTPGSGKSFSVVNLFIRQHSAKKFSMVVYDFKYPDLAKITYYHYLLNKKRKIIDNYKFNVVNFSDVEYSRRINPLKREYIEMLADAMETSEALYESLQKGDRASGNAEFFKTSAVNFLAACIYFFSRHKGGLYSDLPHVLTFINRSYEEIFQVLFSNSELQSLLSPFKTAYDNKAFDQLEGQIGSLKIQISRLVTKESFWIFSGDDFNLKVSDPKNPSYLIIANNPQAQSINSALNALIINRLTRLVNTKGNIPTSIIVDESPTLYFHQIANLLSTARSNKVSVLLGLQEIPQLEEQYGKNIAKTITSVIGNVISGSARAKETLEWLQTIFGKVKQRKEGVSIRKHETTVSINEQMDYLIPASKIAGLPAGSLVGQIALDFGQEDGFPSTMYHCATNLNLSEIKEEEKKYVKLPKFYDFGSKDEREKKLDANFRKIYNEVEEMVNLYM